MRGDPSPTLPLEANDTMRALRIHALGPFHGGSSQLREDRISVPTPGEGEVLVRIGACGICHTELDEIEGRAPPERLPITPGHQVIGTVEACGPGCPTDLRGKTVGIGWIYSACGNCRYCRTGRENLCHEFLATGRDRDGGYAEYLVARAAFVCEIPAALDPAHAAPLLCAGAVGYRALRLAGLCNGESLGLTGFGASGHLVLQMAAVLYPDSAVHVFARDASERSLALRMGAAWAGSTVDSPPRPLAAVIDTTPAWLPVLAALEALEPGGRLVINAIRKQAEDRQQLLALDYERHLWREKSIRSVANVTRQDITDTLALAAKSGLKPLVRTYPLAQAAEGLLAIKSGGIRGANVLLP